MRYFVVSEVLLAASARILMGFSVFWIVMESHSESSPGARVESTLLKPRPFSHRVYLRMSLWDDSSIG